MLRVLRRALGNRGGRAVIPANRARGPFTLGGTRAKGRVGMPQTGRGWRVWCRRSIAAWWRGHPQEWIPSSGPRGRMWGDIAGRALGRTRVVRPGASRTISIGSGRTHGGVVVSVTDPTNGSRGYVDTGADTGGWGSTSQRAVRDSVAKRRRSRRGSPEHTTKAARSFSKVCVGRCWMCRDETNTWRGRMMPVEMPVPDALPLRAPPCTTGRDKAMETYCSSSMSSDLPRGRRDVLVLALPSLTRLERCKWC